MTIFFMGVAFYFLAMGFIGYAASRKVKSLEDYLIVGRKLPFFLAVPTIVATWFGAGSSMGVSGTVYSEGFYGVIADPFGCSLALLITGLVFAAPFRRRKLVTISDLLKKRYGRRFEQVSTLMMIPFYIGTLASQMLAMGYVFHIVSGVSATWGTLIGTSIVMLYTITGGMWAVTLTDFVQFALLVTGLLVILPSCWFNLSDPHAVLLQMKTEFGSLLPDAASRNVDYLAYIGRILMTGLGAIMGQDLLQRSMASKSVSIAKWSAITGSFIYLALGLIPLFIGLAGRYLIPDLSHPEMLIPLLAQKYLSPLAFTFFACGLFSAIMSTADSYLLAGASLFTQNIMIESFSIAHSKRIRAIRLVSIGLAAIALALSLSGHTIFDMMVHSGALLFVSIFVPVTTALFCKKEHRSAAWCSLWGGFFIWLLALYLLSYTPWRLPEEHLFAASTIGFAGSISFYVTARLINPQR